MRQHVSGPGQQMSATCHLVISPLQLKWATHGGVRLEVGPTCDTWQPPTGPCEQLTR
jgi:hypothetical protein